MSGAPSQFRIDQVEGALIQMLITGMPAAYAANLSQAGTVALDIDSIGDRDFNAEGQLVLQPPSMRVFFVGMSYDNLHDNQRLTYGAAAMFEVWCFESSLRSKKDERLQTLVLVATAVDQLAGARLALADGTSSGPTEVKSVSLVAMDDGPIDQLFSITVSVRGIAQFSGANARFGS